VTSEPRDPAPLLPVAGPAPREIRTVLEPLAGFGSREVGRILAQLDGQTRTLVRITADLSPADLAWQPAPGMNTIGMLIAHMAHAEAHLTQIGLLGEPAGHAHDVTGVHERDLGMPLASGASPPAALAGRDAAWFHAMLAAVRAHTQRAAAPLTDDDLSRIVERPPRPDGVRRVFDLAWVLHHIAEHTAGHVAQVALLRRLRRGR
jgi:uncharacterized damage-inducible protein DinB